MSEDEILTKEEVLKFLKVSKTVLEKLMRNKELPYIKLDRRVLFRKKDIDKFLESKLIK